MARGGGIDTLGVGRTGTDNEGDGGSGSDKEGDNGCDEGDGAVESDDECGDGGCCSIPGSGCGSSDNHRCNIDCGGCCLEEGGTKEWGDDVRRCSESCLRRHKDCCGGRGEGIGAI